jgi:hypothetical protein
MNLTKWNKIVLAGILALVLTFSTVSCAFLQDTFADTYVTSIDNVKESNRDMVFPIPLDQLSPEVRDRFEADGKTPVLAKGEDLIVREQAVELSNPGSGGWSDLLNFGLGLANAAWPGAGLLAGVNFIVSRRSRGHMIEAARQMNPFDEGYVDPKEAAVSLARAFGLAHSSPESKAAFVAKTAG